MQWNYKGIFGPDIAFWEGNPQFNQFVDFEKMRASGATFVIVKASQHHYPDPAFAYNWKAAKQAGLLRAAYHFLDVDADGKSQAQTYWNLIKADPGEGPLIVDFESGSGGGKLLYDFLAELLILSGYPPERIWIYTGYYYWIEHTGDDTFRKWFSKFGLWLSWYADLDIVEVPYPWTAAAMWQKTSSYNGPSMGTVSKEVDYNEFNGDVAEFTKYFNVNSGEVPLPPEPTPEPTTGGNTMVQYKVVWSQGVTRHTIPSAFNYSPLFYMNGTVVDVIEENIPDHDDPTNTNKVWVKFADGYYGAAQYPTSAGVPAIRMEKIADPTPVPTVGPHYSFKVEGYKEVAGNLEPE